MRTFPVALVAAFVAPAVCAAVQNHDGEHSKTPPYRDATLCIDDRVDDLMSRMTLEDKAGQMMHFRTTIEDEDLEDNIANQHITHYVFSEGVDDARATAEWYNRIQEYARSTGLGIPITISSDPQHGWTNQVATNLADAFSRWTEPMGIAALRDVKLMRQFAEIAREEFVSVGIRQFLGPQIDLTTEARWGRFGASFSEDANLTAAMAVEYIKGSQGDEIGPYSVIATTKHFPGGGSQDGGNDPHLEFGQDQVYPGGNEEYHMSPFRDAIDVAHTRQIMPYYSKPVGNGWEEVAFGFNKYVITDLLKGQLGFDGIVVTDWRIVTARGWGLLDETELERTRRVLEAGCDIFGGENIPELVVQLVEEGAISEERIDYSVRKLMKEKFELGLFDSAAFVDPDVAERVAGNEYFRRIGNETQRRSFTLLTNGDELLPLALHELAGSANFYLEGVNKTRMEERGLNVVDTPAEADYAFMRLQSPFNLDTDPGLASIINNGSVEFNTTEKARQAEIYAQVPTVVDVRMNRGAAVPEIAEAAAALFASYGSDDDAFLDIIFGTDGFHPEGKLPFDLPRSNQAVEDALEDVPFDTENPLFRFGHGLSYMKQCKRCS